MNRFSGRTVLSSLVVCSFLAIAGIAQADTSCVTPAADPAAPTKEERDAFKATFKTLPTCADAPAGSNAAFFCAETTCTKSGKSCKKIYSDCVADEGCNAAVYCGSLCSATENSVANCASFAGSGLGKALAVKDCADEGAAQKMGTPASECKAAGGSAGSGAGGSGDAGGPAAGGTTGGVVDPVGSAGSSTTGGSAGAAAAPAAADDSSSCAVALAGVSGTSRAAGFAALGMLAIGLLRRRAGK